MFRKIIAALVIAVTSVAASANGNVNWSIGVAGPGYAISTSNTYYRNTAVVVQPPMHQGAPRVIYNREYYNPTPRVVYYPPVQIDNGRAVVYPSRFEPEHHGWERHHHEHSRDCGHRGWDHHDRWEHGRR